MDRVLFALGDFPVTLETALLAGGGLIAALLLAVLVVVLRQASARRDEADAENERRRIEVEQARARSLDLEGKLAGLLQVQSEMTGRIKMMDESLNTRTTQLARLVDDRLDAQGMRMGQAIESTSTRTTETLNQLNQRLAIIDRAQGTIAQLSGEVLGLQAILSNKQTRGAFGQGRMEAIVTDGFGPGSFAFQYTLSNNKRPDCVIFMPNGGPKLVVDAKFPLESWQRLGEAQNEAEVKQAEAGFRRDVGYHVKTIAESYLLPDETQDTALMFVPSESIFADIHERFEDVVQKAMRARVLIVSPSMLLLAVQVIQGLLRDVRMREEAHTIQKEVRELLDDVTRLKDRVISLQKHFAQANDDISNILTSTHKVVRRGERITAVELDEPMPNPGKVELVERKASGGLF